MLQRVCPPAFQEVDDEKAQILVDNIDIVSFRELMDMIDNIEECDDYVVKKIKT